LSQNPAKHRFSSLRSRITLTFLSLILIVQFLGFNAIRLSIEENARKSIDEQLEVGESVFLNLLNQRGENLAQGARILANDYGFKQAIASSDIETVASALENHSSRIAADISLTFTPEIELQATAGDIPSNMGFDEISKLIESAQSGGTPYSIAIFNGVPYQLVVVPVKAPLVIAWIVMGFTINDSLARQLQDVTHLDVTFLSKENQSGWQPTASTMTKSAVDAIVSLSPAKLSKKLINAEMQIADDVYGSRYVEVMDNEQRSLIAVLQRSIDEALAPFLALQLNLLILTIMGAIVFVVGSFLTARHVTRPLTELVETAERLAKGDYSVAIAAKGRDEIADLGRTFNRMREAIAERENKISRLAYWDELTQLPNRAYFTEQLSKFCLESAQSDSPFSVLVMDMDRFKHVNDVLGHSSADKLLIGVANRIKASCKGERDIVGRLGGDEFGVILAGADAKMALDISKRMHKALEQPIALGDHFVDLSAGIGIASYPEHSIDQETLLSRAEIAMYAAKDTNSGSVIYNSSLDVANEDNLSLISEIREAVEKNQLSLYVQPKIDLITGKTISVEALVRWQHPERGLVFPDMFIPFAEQTGHVRKISMWMLAEAARYAAKWQQGGMDVSLAVNLSARDLIDTELPAKLAEILSMHKILSHSLSVEITESSIMEDPIRALQTVERISAMGIKLSIDDFGTGYSSLAYLKRLPVNELKIDKSFVMNIENDLDDATIVRSTIDLGHNLGLKVVAEGVENQRVWDMLKAMGCDYGQGYFMTKPIPADQFVQWEKAWSSKLNYLGQEMAL
jgi:diguanylate cyclase